MVTSEAMVLGLRIPQERKWLGVAVGEVVTDKQESLLTEVSVRPAVEIVDDLVEDWAPQVVGARVAEQVVGTVATVQAVIADVAVKDVSAGTAEPGWV